MVLACEAVVAMGSLLEELAGRQAESRQRIEELRRQLAEVQSRLEAEEERLSRLMITQETVEEILGEAVRPAAEPAPLGEGADAGMQGAEQGAEAVRRGVVTVPPRRPELEMSVLPRAYRDVLEVAGRCRACSR
ncbi:hypothetical protein [Nonomuraea lactucae]|uniref:hypothetical protein n=1 Tax=Nonomuraea lactucae TaxID=2249762 RepID=UPI0013B413F5|nr:hypothetical protein [Nonomuraea lactucae]